MNAANSSTIAMKFPRIIVLKNDVANVGIKSILDFLGDAITFNSEDVF